MQKVFQTKNKMVNLVCPECQKSRQMDVSRFSNINKEIKLKCTCSCGHSFRFILERRQFIRKDVHLSGRIVTKGQTHPVKVIDLSRQGLKIRTERVLDLKKEDKFVIHFNLDDNGKSEISKEVVVKTLFQKNIGAQFLSLEHYDKLGPYLLFNSF